MGVWSCIDGMDQVGWERTRLEIVEDLKKALERMNSRLPGPVSEDTAWTRTISQGRRLVVMRGGWDSAIRAVA